ncbi:MAG: hypothetical protein M0Z25_03930, partial [Nitrospiraceae bacterium]|nr:hypothetical protein [Nitrospiraceae bacterium]
SVSLILFHLLQKLPVEQGTTPAQARWPDPGLPSVFFSGDFLRRDPGLSSTQRRGPGGSPDGKNSLWRQGGQAGSSAKDRWRRRDPVFGLPLSGRRPDPVPIQAIGARALPGVRIPVRKVNRPRHCKSFP